MTTTTSTSPLTELLAQLSPDNKTKGYQFELLAKWWLETDPVYKAKFRWVKHFNEWEHRWSNKDLGTDLIATDTDGKLWAIQAKGYKEDGDVSHTDMGKFLADSNRDVVDFRLLISSSRSLGPNATAVFAGQPKNKPVFTVMRSDLEQSDVNWPESILNLYAPQPEPKTPYDYQVDAINDVVNGFADADRGQLLMVSGTGKTLTGMFIHEKLGSKNTLVLLPSLLLLKQTLKVWRANSAVPFKSLPVGSDPTANNFGIDVLPSSMGYPTTTNVQEIVDFLREDGVKVVFSTYQSSDEIGAAQATAGVPAFDLVIVDEAHNTAGKLDSYFANVLHDEARETGRRGLVHPIKASRRLFMTATPRNFTPRVLDRAVEVGDPHASMDDEACYGKVFHELPYAKALELKLVTDYKIAIVAITEHDIREWAERGHHVKIDGVDDNLNKVASQVAVLKAMRQFCMHRVITYHNRVERASDFASTLNQALSWLPEDERPAGELWARHIHGEMSVDDRTLLLNQLGGPAEGQRKVLANARVLTEGVDVPALDGIAILDPKRSAIDIYQAQGRAIRLDPDKPNPTEAISYTIIPVFIPMDADDAEAQDILNSSAFEPVWRELLAMRLFDKRFAEWVDHFRLEKGKAGLGWKPTLPPMVETNLHEVFGADFARSFAVKLVDMTSAPWEERFGMLLQFVDEHGHARVPKDYEIDGVKLGNWVASQRALRIKKLLSPDREQRLDKVPGWSWDVQTDQWEAAFSRLLDFVKENGLACVPAGYEVDGVKLGVWVGSQRARYAKGLLEDDRKARLLELPGWSWNARDAQWEEGFSRLLDFVKDNGHARVPAGYEVNGVKLGTWVSEQRGARTRKTIKPDREQRFQELPGWSWDARTDQWEEMFNQFLDYVKVNGHALVPKDYEVKGVKLGNWIATQRRHYAKGLLEDDRKARLSKVDGWVWNSVAALWEEGFSRLLDFVKANGHALAPPTYEIDGYGLGRWVSKQRAARRRGDLLPDREDRLKNLPGWSWGHTDRWVNNFSRLLDFVKANGHALVPQNYEVDGVGLGRWVSKQRQLYTKGKLDADRIDRLSKVDGWEWNPPMGPRPKA